uniref:Uncharacterized protein n=1 Tax=Oncorhynchus mykiss TaxID=8022 RepID=A0A8C7S6P5_ONCMY
MRFETKKSESLHSDYVLAHDLETYSLFSIRIPCLWHHPAAASQAFTRILCRWHHPAAATQAVTGILPRHMLSKTAHQQNPCLFPQPKGSLYHAHDAIKRPTIYCAEHCSSLSDLFPWIQATGQRRGRQTEENKKDTFPVNMLDQNEIKKQSKETDNKIQTSDEEGKG